MKKQIPFLKTALIIVCLGMICTTSTIAQKYSYKPLALEGAHWWVGLWDINNPPWAETDHYQYVVRGDTILDDITYKKVYFREITDSIYHYIEYEFLSRLVRDDTTNKKVYAIYLDNPNWECPENEEILLYDFNLNVGDSMNTCLTNWTGPNIIRNIDYDYIYGEERKILHEFNGRFIEGIGSDFGVFEWGLGSKDNKGWGYMLINYCLGTDEECECQWVGIEDREAVPTFKIYPNPLTGNTLTLVPHTPITHALDVKLFDINGREVFQQHFENFTNEVTIQIPAHLSSVASPLLLWVGKGQNVFYKQLIIKQRD